MQFKFNIPNKITLIRVALIPLFAIVLAAKIPYKNLLAAFIFIMLSVSDFLDGYFARKKKQVTEFGKLIDPIADKLLISTALVFLVMENYSGISPWMAGVIIGREIILTAIRIYLIPSRLVIPASSFGKAKTVVQSIAIVFVLLDLPLAWHVMLAAVFLTLVSGIEYLLRIRQMTGNRIVNLPNLLTLSRLLLIIPFVYYLIGSGLHQSLIFFAIITLTDKLDGISARLMNQKTEFGSAFDSFTDWTLITITFIVFVLKGRIELFWLVLLAAASFVSGIMKMIYAKKRKIVPVTFVARLGVGMTYITIISILINFAYANYMLTLTATVVYLAMADYTIKALTLPKKNSGRRQINLFL